MGTEILEGLESVHIHPKFHKNIAKVYKKIDKYINKDLYIFLSLAKLTNNLVLYEPVCVFIIAPKAKGKTYLLRKLDENYPTLQLACMSTSIGIVGDFLEFYQKGAKLREFTYTLQDGTTIMNRGVDFICSLTGFLTPLLSDGHFRYSTYSVTKQQKKIMDKLNDEYDGVLRIQFNFAVAKETLRRNDKGRVIEDVLREGTFLDRFAIISFTIDFDEEKAIARRDMHRENGKYTFEFAPLELIKNPDEVIIPPEFDDMILDITFYIAEKMTKQSGVRVNNYLTTLMRVVAAVEGRDLVVKEDIFLVLSIALKYCNYDCSSVALTDRIEYCLGRFDIQTVTDLRLKLFETYDVKYGWYTIRNTLESIGFTTEMINDIEHIYKIKDNEEVITGVEHINICDEEKEQTQFVKVDNNGKV